MCYLTPVFELYSQSHYSVLYSVSQIGNYTTYNFTYTIPSEGIPSVNTDRYIAPPKDGSLTAPMRLPLYITATWILTPRDGTLASYHLSMKPAHMQRSLPILPRIPRGAQFASLRTLPPMAVYLLY